MAKKHYKGISRIDSNLKNMHGWYARVYLNAKTYDSQYFNDRKYDGKRKGLKAAVVWRNEKVAERNKKYPESKNARRKLGFDKRNKTGVIGVSRSRLFMPNGKPSYFYEVTWYPKKGIGPKTKHFSIKKFGEFKALYLAWKTREAAEMKIFGKTQTPNLSIWEKHHPLPEGYTKMPTMVDLEKEFSGK